MIYSPSISSLTIRERKDAHGRRPGDPDYDPKTLYLPQEFLKSLSGGQVVGFAFMKISFLCDCLLFIGTFGI